MTDDYRTRLARARRLQAVVLVIEVSAAGIAALVVGMDTASFEWALFAFFGAGVFFVVVGSLALAASLGYESRRRLRKERESQR